MSMVPRLTLARMDYEQAWDDIAASREEFLSNQIRDYRGAGGVAPPNISGVELSGREEPEDIGESDDIGVLPSFGMAVAPVRGRASVAGNAAKPAAGRPSVANKGNASRPSVGGPQLQRQGSASQLKPPAVARNAAVPRSSAHRQAIQILLIWPLEFKLVLDVRTLLARLVIASALVALALPP
jgi:hypothetical protein